MVDSEVCRQILQGSSEIVILLTHSAVVGGREHIEIGGHAPGRAVVVIYCVDCLRGHGNRGAHGAGTARSHRGGAFLDCVDNHVAVFAAGDGDEPSGYGHRLAVGQKGFLSFGGIVDGAFGGGIVGKHDIDVVAAHSDLAGHLAIYGRHIRRALKLGVKCGGGIYHRCGISEILGADSLHIGSRGNLKIPLERGGCAGNGELGANRIGCGVERTHVYENCAGGIGESEAAAARAGEHAVDGHILVGLEGADNVGKLEGGCGGHLAAAAEHRLLGRFIVGHNHIFTGLGIVVVVGHNRCEEL